MTVTPLDIRRKEFKRSVRGYADEEVDLFLDEIADEFERLHQQNNELLERLRRVEEQSAGHQQLRDALEKILVSAQLQADETRAGAHRESEAIVQDARAKAGGIVGEAHAEMQRLQQALVRLKQLEEDFRSKFRSLLEGHLQLLVEPPLDLDAAQQAVIDSTMVPEAMQVSTASWSAAPSGGPGAGTPFVVPTALEEVPEFSTAATLSWPETSAVSEPALPISVEVSEEMTATVAEIPLTPEATPVTASSVPAVPLPTTPVVSAASVGAASIGASVVEAPVVEAPVALTPPVVAPEAEEPPAALLGGERLAGADTDETATAEQADLVAAAEVDDESLTLVSEDDPLRDFFFSPNQDGGREAFFENDKGAQGKARDFEW